MTFNNASQSYPLCFLSLTHTNDDLPDAEALVPARGLNSMTTSADAFWDLVVVDHPGVPCERQATIDHFIHFRPSKHRLDYVDQIGPPVATLGTLSVLPLEIRQAILADVPVATLNAFSQVNRAALLTRNSVAKWRALMLRAPKLLGSVIITELARSLSLNTLWEEMCHPGCRTCGDATEFIYLLDCRRVCLLCYRDLRFILIENNVAEMTRYDQALAESLLSSIPYMRLDPTTLSADSPLDIVQPMLAVDRVLLKAEAYARELANDDLRRLWPHVMNMPLFRVGWVDDEPSMETLLAFLGAILLPTVQVAWFDDTRGRDPRATYCPDCTLTVRHHLETQGSYPRGLPLLPLGPWREGERPRETRGDSDPYRLHDARSWDAHLRTARTLEGGGHAIGVTPIIEEVEGAVEDGDDSEEGIDI